MWFYFVASTLCIAVGAFLIQGCIIPRFVANTCTTLERPNKLTEKNSDPNYPNFSFTIKKTLGKARLGTIKTPHGDIQTPAFIFCATKAAMRSTTTKSVEENRSQIILSNTYHLFLKGHEDIKRMGGLHKAVGWRKPMLTDSGGYQIFAMNHQSVSSDIKGAKTQYYKPTLIEVTEKEATFRSYYTNQVVKLSPEKSMEVQRNLGADIVLVLDECTSSGNSKEYTKTSMEMSHRWEKRSLDAFMEHNDHRQALYGIVQGGVYEDLREESCDFVNSQPFFGVAVGGCLGKTTEEMHHIVSYTMDRLKKDRPVHLLGIGYLKDIFNGVECGVDTFDCVHPTRIARHGCALVKYSPDQTSKQNRTNSIDLNQTKYKDDDQPISIDCECTTCARGITRSYLHLLMKSKENIYQTYVTDHNIFFMNKLMEDIRQGIEDNDLDSIKEKYVGEG